ncbi:MAG: translation initiation factor [Muribaculaceae bacterium]|nr:translation initiation factor [Muribaculaceae bacterium]
MAIDWKDALSALKDSGNIPVDNTPDPIPVTTDKALPQASPLRVVIDRKGRKGKTATIIEGFSGSDEQLEQLAKTLKQRLGTGGSARGGEILIQGDRKNDVITLLKSLGYKTKN